MSNDGDDVRQERPRAEVVGRLDCDRSGGCSVILDVHRDATTDEIVQALLSFLIRESASSQRH
jgi:hypothetical protein